jgi:hypothetical protein
MTGIKQAEFESLSSLLEVPDIDLSDTPGISSQTTETPIPVNILLMPGEHTDFQDAMSQALGMVGPKVIPIIGDDQVAAYDYAMSHAMDLQGVKLRNVGLVTICRVFTSMPKEQREALVNALVEVEEAV